MDICECPACWSRPAEDIVEEMQATSDKLDRIWEILDSLSGPDKRLYRTELNEQMEQLDHKMDALQRELEQATNR